MLFNTAHFGVFLFIVLLVYWGLSRFRGLRLGFLLAASYYFYAAWNPSYLILIIAVSVVDYLGARVLSALPGAFGRKCLVACVVIANLLVLGYWKYTHFLIEVLAPYLKGEAWFPQEPLNIILPVGISFFVFQGLSYVIDVYRNDVIAEKSLFRFALYIAFFPQLVAGPIIRSKDLLHQFDQPFRLEDDDFGHALYLILGGLLKKALFADYLAANLLDRVFEHPDQFSSLEVLAAVYGYALQIYGDFSGYTDIAIGVALLLGFKLPPNFNLPYRANGLQDFWRRWHISLSTWLRDYLYIPLGGSRPRNRAGRVANEQASILLRLFNTVYRMSGLSLIRRLFQVQGGGFFTQRNLFITMLLGGLWHGASWNFIIWGAMHGIGLAVWRGVGALRARLRPQTPHMQDGPCIHVLRVCLTFHFVIALWVFFRADSFDKALLVFQQIGSMTPGTVYLNWKIIAVLSLGYCIHFAPLRLLDRIQATFVHAAWYVQSILAVCILCILKWLAQDVPQQFIYFQF